jgi:tetratricopeptide (TPR) repeat protein
MNKALFFIFILLMFSSTLPGHAVEAGLKDDALKSTEKGWRYLHIGDLDVALKRFRQAIILDPDFAPGYFGVGYIYNLQDRLSLAIQYLRKAVRLPNPPPTHVQMLSWVSH